MKDKVQKEQWIVPFWAVSSTPDTAVSNVDQHLMKVKVGNGVVVDVPVLKNKKAILSGAELFIHDNVRKSFGVKRKAAGSQASDANVAKVWF